MKKIISIYSRDSFESCKTKRILEQKLDKVGIRTINGFEKNSDLLICIGGDGTFLEAVHKFDFPKVPIIGINTGHLGFFQEILPAQLDDLIFNFCHNKYTIQELSPVKGIVTTKSNTFIHYGLNEIVVKNDNPQSVHMNISIGGEFIQRFSGDGILVSAPAGSTGYNYSLGGSIIDPRLKLLQVTPIAPMNTTAYRSFTSSILLPSDLSLGIIPEFNNYSHNLQVTYDGNKSVYEDVVEIKLMLSDTKIRLLRFEDYDFWTKVKSKFL